MGSISIVDYTIGYGGTLENFRSAQRLRSEGFGYLLSQPEAVIEFRNKSDKVIKYVHFEAYFIDRVGEVVPWLQTVGDITTFTGPLEPKRTARVLTPSVLDSQQMINSMHFEKVAVEYMDGTREIIERKELYLEFMEPEIVQQLKQIDFNGPDCKRQMDAFVAWSEQFGVNRVQIRFLFDEILRMQEAQELTVDGEEYETVKDAEKANGEIQQFLRSVKEISGNDREKMKEMMDALEASGILSKDKYIDYLRDRLEAEDIRYRTVKDILFDTREEAETAREEASVLADISSVVKDKTSIAQVEKLVSDLQTGKWKEEATKYLEYCQEVMKEQDRLDASVTYREYETIGELVDELCPLMVTAHKAGALNVVNPDWDKMYSVILDKLCIVNGQRINKPEDAIRAHYKWIEHAKGYYKYRTEKAVGSGLLSKLKTGITGVVYKNYEAEYLSLTKNETVPLPNDGKEFEEQTMKIFFQECTLQIDFFDELLKDYKKLLGKKIKAEDCKLDMSKLFVPPIKVDQATINEILGRLFPSLNRREFY